MTRTTTTMTTTTSRAPTGRRKNIPAAARRRLVETGTALPGCWLVLMTFQWQLWNFHFLCILCCVQRISLLSFLNSKSVSSQWEDSSEGDDFIWSSELNIMTSQYLLTAIQHTSLLVLKCLSLFKKTWLRYCNNVI